MARLSGRDLQRRQRAQEIAYHDAVFKVADVGASEIEQLLARAAVGAYTGRDITQHLKDAQSKIRELRIVLRRAFDGIK